MAKYSSSLVHHCDIMYANKRTSTFIWTFNWKIYTYVLIYGLPNWLAFKEIDVL